MHRLLLIITFGLLAAAVNADNPPVEGGCMLGESQLAHGLSPADAELRIRRYARMYVKKFASYKNYERSQRKRTYAYMEMDEWTQAEVIGFTREQREFMYISVGGELATGRVTGEQLPGYASAIERKLYEIELELGCDNASDS
jgi:hypothetical protein